MRRDDHFHLGIDLGQNPSPAQTEDQDTPTLVANLADRRDYFVERGSERFAGVHLLVDLRGARRLDDIEHIEATLRDCVEVSGASLLHIHLHRFTPNGGVSGVAVLAESHISVHTWPEANFAAVDVFMCGDTRPELCVQVLSEAFGAAQTDVNEVHRGCGL